MSHIFISYAREDYNRANALAGALQKSRVPVWWDPQISAGERWEPAIENAIRQAAAVVVLWSRNSINSDWVYREATLAVEQKNLVPARIDPVNPPGQFGQYDSADLTTWQPGRPHREFDKLRRQLLGLFGGEGAWRTERLDKETLLVRLDVEEHTVRYSRGHLYVDGEIAVEGAVSVTNKRSFNFELRDGKRYYPARLDVIVTMMRGDVKKLSLSVGGSALYEG